MSNLPRKTLSELTIRYKLEPDLDDIYVEGSFDKELLDYVALKSNSKKVIYCIDSVDIPLEILSEYGLTNGNRQRVIAAAKKINESNPSCLCKFLIDKDFDDWAEAPIEYPKNIRRTKYSCIESYFFSSNLLKDILVTGGQIKIENWSDFVTSLTDVLISLSTIRYVNQNLNWALTAIALDKYLVKTGSTVTFALKEYIQNLLMNNSKGKKEYLDTFNTSFVEKTLLIPVDPRNHLNGHDFVELVVWSIKKFKGITSSAEKKTIEAFLIFLSPQIPDFHELIH